MFKGVVLFWDSAMNQASTLITLTAPVATLTTKSTEFVEV
jgi:hypothetical protein